jgi:hypothetical protein
MTRTIEGAPFKFKDRSKRYRSDINDGQLHAHTKMTPIGKTKGGPSWMGGSAPIGPNEDDPSMMSMATLMASKDGGTYETQDS